MLRLNLRALQERAIGTGKNGFGSGPGMFFMFSRVCRGRGKIRFDLRRSAPSRRILWVKILEMVDGNQVLAEDGLLVMQVRRDRILPERVGTWPAGGGGFTVKRPWSFWRCLR